MRHKKLILLFLVLLIPRVGLGAGIGLDSRNQKLSIDGVYRELTTVNIEGNNYMGIRDLAQAMKQTQGEFNVVWNEEEKIVEIERGKDYRGQVQDIKFSGVRPRKNQASILIDGEEIQMSTYLIEGNNFFKLRDIGQLLDFNIGWNSEKKLVTMNINPVKGGSKLETCFDLDNNFRDFKSIRFGRQVKTFIIDNHDGSYSILNAGDKYGERDYLSLETYDLSDQLIASKKIKKEMPLFGGFYKGDSYNYIVFGDKNPGEEKNKDIIEVVKYDRKFKKLDSLFIKGGEAITVEPFAYGVTRMAERGKLLSIHTSRLRFKGEDGLNHQSQLTLNIDTEKMELIEGIEAFQKNHVSHSFDQYVAFNDLGPVYLDHGDAYPRSIVINRPKGQDLKEYEEEDLIKIPGRIGDNYTGVSLGGFERMGQGFLLAMNSADQSLDPSVSGADERMEKRDIRLVYTGLNPGGKKEDRLVKKYSGTDRFGSVPQLIKFDSNLAMLVWQEFDGQGRPGDLVYHRVDTSRGLDLGPEKRLENYLLSDSSPGVISNKLIWTVNTEEGQLKYEIDCNQ